jgi:hypothetical protein
MLDVGRGLEGVHRPQAPKDRWFRRSKHWLLNQRWWIFATLALITFVLGVAGFTDHFNAIGEGRPAADRVYLSLQLFTLESGSIEEPIGWELNIARLMAPALFATGAAGVISAVISALRDRGSMASARRDHVVVCGLGRMGFGLVTRLLERGDRVVAIDLDAQLADTHRHGARRLTVLHGDATSPSVLERARLGTAKELYAVTGNDGVNAAIAVQAQGIERSDSKLESYVHIVDDELNRLLIPVLETEGQPDGSMVRSHLVNVYALASRLIVKESPHINIEDGAVVLIIGVGGLGQSLVVELANRLGSRDRPLVALLVDRRAKEKAAALEARHPKLRSLWSLRVHEADITGQAFEDGDYLDKLQLTERVDQVFVLMQDDQLALVTALTVARTLGRAGAPPPILVRMTQQDSGLGLLIRPGFMPPAYASVRVFDIHDATCRPEVFAEGKIAVETILNLTENPVVISKH